LGYIAEDPLLGADLQYLSWLADFVQMPVRCIFKMCMHNLADVCLVATSKLFVSLIELWAT
jgi:hypothetical protein